MYTLGSSFAWSLISILLFESKRPIWWKYIASWALGAACDIILLSTSSLSKVPDDQWLAGHLVTQVCRIALFTAAASYTALVLRKGKENEPASDEETQSLLSAGSSTRTATAYGSATGADADPDAGDSGDDDESDEDKEEDKIKALQEQRLQEIGWVGYLKGFLVFMPHLIPYKDRMARVWLLVLFACLAAERLTTLFIPLQLAKIIDALASSQGTGMLLHIFGFCQDNVST